MLQAFADESDAGTMDRGVFTVSGYVGFPLHWTSLSARWDEVIQGDEAFKKIGYFKSSALTSNAWRKEHGITKGDANRLHEKLIPVIQTSDILFSAIATLRCEDWHDVIAKGPLGKAEWVNNPYYFCYHVFCSGVLRKVHELQIAGEQVDFVFDNKDAISDRANEMFRWLRDESDLSPVIKNLMGDAIPGDDKKLAPLQIADVLSHRVKESFMQSRNKKLQERLLSIAWQGDRNITIRLHRSNFERFVSGYVEQFGPDV